MTIYVHDTFTAADGVALVGTPHNPDSGGSWSSLTANDYSIRSNQAVAVSVTAMSLLVASSAPASANYQVRSIMVYPSIPSGGVIAGSWMGVVGRCTDINNYYDVIFYTPDHTWYLEKTVAGVTSTLDTWSGDTWAQFTTRTIILSMNGTTIKANIDGVDRITGSDSSLSSIGKGGIYGRNGTSVISAGYAHEEFWVEDIASTSVSGTIAVTERADVATITGASTVPGAIAVTERADIAALVGANISVLAGTLSAVEAPDTVAMAGIALSAPVVGTIAVTERADVMTGTGVGAVGTGTIFVTERADVAALSGYVARIGTIAVTERADTIALTGIGDMSSFSGVNEPYSSAFNAAYSESEDKLQTIRDRQEVRMDGLQDGLTRLPPEPLP